MRTINQPKVLLVDDDIELVAMLAEYLEREGFEVARAYEGESGVVAALTDSFDLVVLDVMMPKLGGIEALRRIRAGSSIPILMLTGRGDDADRVIGLELGADDYVPKPCTPREIVARIRAILRRSLATQSTATAQALMVGALVLWPEQRRAAWDEKPMQLTSTEFNLLELLAKNAGRVVSKTELSENALGRPLSRFDRSIDVHMSSIRQKIDPLPDGRSRIQTVFRQGYQLVRE